jgi:hypothetical protein
MRIITPAGRGHNRDGMLPAGLMSLPAVLLILAALAAAAGCGGDQRRAAPPAGAVAQVKLDVAALNDWLAILKRLESGKTVPAESYQRLFELPAYALQGKDPRIFSPGILQKCTEYACLRAAGDTADVTPPRRDDIVANCDYLRRRADEARDFADVLADDQYRGRVWELARRWIGESRLPGSLTIHAMVGPTSIGFQAPDHVILDAGLALAAGREQAARMTASRLYAELAPPSGPQPPAAASGREALRQTLRFLQHGAVIAWIAGGADLEFDGRHDHLGAPRLETRTTQERAAGLLNYSFRMLEGMLDPGREDQLQANGRAVDDLLRPRWGYETLGFAMAEVIAARGGEEALLALSGDTAAFLDAYQSALDADAVMPPFPPQLLEQLRELVREP